MQLEPHLGDLEDKYRRHHLSKDRMSISITAVPWLLFNVYFIRADYHLFGFAAPFTLLLISKGLYCALTLGMLLVLKRLTEPQHVDWLVFGWSVLSTTFIFWHELSRPRAYAGHYPLDVLIVVSLYLMPNRWLFRLTAALFFSALALIGLLLYKGNVPQLEANAIIAAFFLANTLGIISSTRLFSYRREQFRAVIEERQAKEALAILAQTDPLTGVLNRRAFSDRGAQEFQEFKRYQHLFAVHVIDLDFFKTINDTFGHRAGDETLKQFVQLVLRYKRETDVFGRLGGEEFGLILPNTSAASARVLGERIRAATQATPIQLAQTNIPITLSMGIAEVQPHDGDFDDLLNRADRLLYQAKRNGRNRVEYTFDGAVSDQGQRATTA